MSKSGLGLITIALASAAITDCAAASTPACLRKSRRAIMARWTYYLQIPAGMRLYSIEANFMKPLFAIVLLSLVAQAQPAGPYKILKNAKVGGDGGFDYVY